MLMLANSFANTENDQRRVTYIDQLVDRATARACNRQTGQTARDVSGSDAIFPRKSTALSHTMVTMRRDVLRP
jgi:hypothetical protein